MSTQVRAHDVVRYTPGDRWCREGIAIAEPRADGTFVLVDTFWGGGTERHVLTAAEAATIDEVEFNLEDVDPYDPRTAPAEWLDYEPADRARYTEQHGLRSRLFIRKGAKPTSAAKISRLRAERDDAQREFDSALRSLVWAENALHVAMREPLDKP